MTKPLEVRRNSGKIWSHIRQQWLTETPEESVRQEYVCNLANHYGYSIDQMDEELSVPGKRGTKDARGDIVIWRSVSEKQDGATAIIVVECKADTVTVDQRVYVQGANYAQFERAKFFVAHNRRDTKFFKVDLAKRAPNYSEIDDIPEANASDKQIAELLARLKKFEGKEFADLLHACHNDIRNNEHLDPAAAFDEIAKILFIKVRMERRLKAQRERENLFTVQSLRGALKYSDDPINFLFDQTKAEFRADKIFKDDERVNLRLATVESIVARLERYNLSETSEDIKGIAFEKFLGETFRGEIGQFFTPRPMVEFMIRMIDPKEDEKICDPASGSGGFLIRFFEIVREQIAASVDAEYRAFATAVEKRRISKEKKAQLLREKDRERQQALDPVSDPDAAASRRQKSRIWKLANLCIYGTDANDRMARTSKMNMIMHGDGHGGVHHHNGLLNVNGIFEGRFDIILTNPPFGANVTDSAIVLESDVRVSSDARSRYRGEYGSAYDDAIARVAAAAENKKPILSLFTLPKSDRIKTEILFIERCIDLLQPGGRLGIVLPEGIFNNSTLGYVREFCEDRARINAVVSLPQETFKSSGADVKCSLLFLTKYTVEKQGKFDATKAGALAETRKKYAPEIAKETTRLQAEIASAKATKSAEKGRILRKQLADFEKVMEDKIALEARTLLKRRCDYPIFLYEADRVGITATGDPDQNELYPNERQPPEPAKTALEHYREFEKDPQKFAAKFK